MTPDAGEIKFNANRIEDEGRISLGNALVRNETLTYLNLGSARRDLTDLPVVSSQDHWIIRKNQSLYDLLSRYL